MKATAMFKIQTNLVITENLETSAFLNQIVELGKVSEKTFGSPGEFIEVKRTHYRKD